MLLLLNALLKNNYKINQVLDSFQVIKQIG